MRDEGSTAEMRSKNVRYLAFGLCSVQEGNSVDSRSNDERAPAMNSSVVTASSGSLSPLAVGLRLSGLIVRALLPTDRRFAD
jgi:hypothetical protein